MGASGEVVLVLEGAWRLNRAQRTSLMTWIKHGFGPIVTDAGRVLVVVISEPHKRPKAVKDSPASMHLDLTFETENAPKRHCGLVVGECGSGTISITNHRQMGVCGTDSKTRNRTFLTTDELLGHALANTSLHELGHLIASFADNRDAGNFMSTLGPPRDKRTLQSQRQYWAGAMSWTGDQKRKLVQNIKAGKKAFDDEFTVTGSGP